MSILPENTDPVNKIVELSERKRSKSTATREKIDPCHSIKNSLEAYEKGGQKPHKFLRAHGIRGHTSRVYNKSLLIPIQNRQGKLICCQSVTDAADKPAAPPGVKLAGLFSILNPEASAAVIRLTSDYPTAATITELTNDLTIYCCSAANVVNVARHMREAHRAAKIIINSDIGADKEAKAAAFSPIIQKPESDGYQNTPTFNALARVAGSTVAAEQLKIPSTEHQQALSITDFMALDIPEQDIFIAPIIRSHSITMIHAAPGVGKTFFATDLAAGAAAGESAIKWDVPAAIPVLLVDGEMPRAMLKSRYDRIMTQRGSALRDNFHILSAEQFDGDKTLEDGLDLSIPSGQAVVEAAIDEIGAKLLVLDNQDSLFFVDENKQKDLLYSKQWLKSLRGRGIAVVIVHHSNKSGGYSGHNAMARNPDLIINLKRPDDYTGEQGAVFDVVFEKTRGLFGADVESFRCEMTESGWNIEGNRLSVKGILLSIVEFLHEDGGECSLDDIAGYVANGDDFQKTKNTIKQALTRHMKTPKIISFAGKGMIINRNRGKYSVSESAIK